MWIKHVTIAFCFVAASVYAQPTSTPATLTTPPAVIGQEGCLSQPIIQSPNSTFIVVTKRGRGRSFRDRHPGLFSGSTVIQSDGSGRDLDYHLL